MSTFDKREDGFEKKFVHDEELRFKANARRNKLLGLWAAGLLGKSGADADAYAQEVIASDFKVAGDAGRVRQGSRRFRRRGRRPVRPPASPHVDELMEEAIRQLQS